jgi:hypothetical protein
LCRVIPLKRNLNLLIFCLVQAFAWAAPVNFDREVRPILSDACYHCHGPDEKARKAKLRLDTKEGAFRVQDGKAVILPGKSSESELFKRITSADPDEKMPPPDSNRKVTPEQIEKLKRWIDEGAKWETHWAFVAPKKNPLPKVQKVEWPRNGIDYFVLSRLEQESLQPAAEARKETLLRRVSLDLTGLPPTQKEVDDFLNDKSTDAYERAVDRLLASDRYGERMATDWLDVARYADTHGYQADRYRPMWPYRDWVIKAFNQNLPFDQFATSQIAGDLLPNASKDQRLATAFNRLHMQNEEGGIIEEEYRVAYVIDRVDTFGTAFLGLTFECSRCHDHKFDPISMKDFYSMFSFFQNIDECGQTSYFTDPIAVPTLILSDDEQDAKVAALEKQISAREKEFFALRESEQEAFGKWLASKESMDFERLPGLAGRFDFNDANNRLTNRAGGESAKAVEGPKYGAGHEGDCAELNGENGFIFPKLGHFKKSDPFSFSIWVNAPSHAARAVVIHHSKAPVDAGSRGYELLLENGHVGFGLHHMWPGNSIKVASKDAISTNQWVHLAVTYDGSSRADGAHIYINGESAPVEVVRDGLYKDITYGGEPDLAIGHRFRDSGFKDGKVDDFSVFNRALTPLEIAQLAGRDDLKRAWSAQPEKLTDTQRSGLFEFYVSNVSTNSRALLDDLHTLRAERNGIIEPIAEVMVMKEMEKPKPAYILKRGAYDAHGDEVTANTPAVLPPLGSSEPRNRLGLAHWLTAPENPLMARVTVNRAWQLMFGRGIVETTENFGSQGSTPSHPELLDWLAREFIESGWDMKALFKLIATSATYRQSSKADPDLLARDPANQLLARGPARRLTAEMLRDQALAASGLLVEKIGGPSVKPYQPEGLWEEIAMGRPHYDTGKGADLHRRSLYTFWKRTVPHPAMITFDAAERNVCLVRRQNTSTPLQALELLNDTQIVEAARFLVQRMFKEGGSDLDSQLAWAFRTVTSREPNKRERGVLKKLFDEQRDLFEKDAEASNKLLNVGETGNDPAFKPSYIAAGTAFAEALLNYDEAVIKR